MSGLSEVLELDNWISDIYFEFPLCKTVPKILSIMKVQQRMINKYYNYKLDNNK